MGIIASKSGKGSRSHSRKPQLQHYVNFRQFAVEFKLPVKKICRREYAVSRIICNCCRKTKKVPKKISMLRHKNEGLSISFQGFSFPLLLSSSLIFMASLRDFLCFPIIVIFNLFPGYMFVYLFCTFADTKMNCIILLAILFHCHHIIAWVSLSQVNNILVITSQHGFLLVR